MKLKQIGLGMILVGTLITQGCRNAEIIDKTKPVLKNDVMILSMYSEDLKLEYESFTSPVAKEITKQTGVKLDIQFPIEGVAEKINLMLSSGEYPDLIMIKDTSLFVEAEAYIDLRPLIEAHAPNIKKLYGDSFNRLKYSMDDPSIYVLPTKPVNEERWQPEMGFQLQHDVVKALGSPKLETVLDFEQAIKAYMAMNPMINGEPTIGITFVNEDWRWKISLGNGSGFATGAPDDGNWYVDPETHEATYRFLRPEEKLYYQWINRIYHEGLIDPDSFVQNYEAYAAKIASGRVVGLIDPQWHYDYAEKILKANNQLHRMYGRYPIQYDKSTISADFREVGYIGGYGIGISKNCKDPIAAIKFLDFMASEEGQILRHWGIENVHYFYDVNRLRKFFPEEIDKQRKDPDYYMKTGIDIYVYPFPTWGIGVLDSTGNPFNPDNKAVVISNYSDIEKEVLNAYGVTMWSELYPQAEALEVSTWGQAWDIPIPSSSNVREALETCDQIMKDGLVKLIVSPPETFDQNWEEMMTALEAAGVHEMGRAFTELVKQRIAFWEN